MFTTTRKTTWTLQALADLPDSLWMVTRPLSETAISREVTCCSPRCLVLWLEREHKPRGLGVAL